MLKYSIEEKIVKLSNIDLLDTSVQEKIIMSLINVEEDATFKNTAPRESASFVRESPLLQVNCGILISAQFSKENYTAGLTYLSSILRYFKNTPVFSAANSPELHLSISRLRMEMREQTLETMSNLWRAIGAELRPSLLYKLNIVSTDDAEIDIAIPTVSQIINKPI